MAVACPKCGIEIEQDFGLVHCPGCAVMLAVDVDGSVQVAEAPEQAVEVEAEAETSETSEVSAPSEEFAEMLPQDEDSSPDALAEITQFGNRDSSAGPLSYSLTVAGIDAGNIRQQVITALNKPQMGQSVAQIGTAVHAGVLQLRQLTPAQAVMALRLLRGIPVQLTWEQHIYE